jgi:hypothetical protein
VRALLLLCAAMIAAPALAEGPGTQIRAAPAAPRQLSPAAERDADRCNAMRGEQRERCMKNLRAAASADDKARGPEATGAASGASGSSTTGASGGSTAPGGAAPR